MRRGRHGSAGFDTDAESAQRAAESAGTGGTTAGSDEVRGAGTPGSTGTTTGAGAMGTAGTAAGVTTTTTAGPAAGGYQRGAEPSAAYRGVAAGGDIPAAGVTSILAGLLTFLAGLAAVVRWQFFATLPGYAYSWNVRNWGIILIVLGALLFAAGACTLLGMGWARAVGAGLAVLTAVAGFLFLAYTPIWGVIIVAVSVVAIWGLLHGAGRREQV
jgi:hypothetical protein